MSEYVIEYENVGVFIIVMGYFYVMGVLVFDK